MKEFIIRIDDMRHEKKVARLCKKIAREAEGEYYTKVIDTNYSLVHLTRKPKNTILYDEKIMR